MELFAVQREALKRADGRPGYAFLLEQGLGKTGLTCTEYKGLRKNKAVDLLFILCPNSLKNNWKEELERWYPDVTIGVWPSFDPRKEKVMPDAFVMNYEAVISSGFDAALKYVQAGRCYMSLDESTRIKSHTAQTTKKVLLLSKYVVFRRILTGTPFVNNVMDLWAQLRFIGELDGVNPYAFRNHFAVLGGYMGKQVVGLRNEAELHRLLDGCAFRAKKADWMKDLPAKLPPVIRDVVMSEEQMAVYEEMRQDFYTLVQKNEISAAQTITQMGKLMQISRGFLYDENGKALELVKPEHNPCIKELISIVEQTSGKIIIVTVHKYTSRLIRSVFPNAAYIMGNDDMDGSTVEEQKYKFNNDKKCREIICQVSVGAHGHTLLGGPGEDRCSTMAFFENNFNLEQRLQMEDRCHRIGQTNAVSYFDIAASPLDRKVIRALQKKESMAKAIVDAVKTTPL